MLDASGSAHLVLSGVAPAASVPPTLPLTDPTLFDPGTGGAAAAGALAVAALGLYGGRLPPVLRRAAAVAGRPVARLRDLQSGDVRDYVAWLALGTGVFGGALALACLR
jgi:hypothetical protein